MRYAAPAVGQWAMWKTAVPAEISDLLRQLATAARDLDWHSLTRSTHPETIEAFSIWQNASLQSSPEPWKFKRPMFCLCSLVDTAMMYSDYTTSVREVASNLASWWHFRKRRGGRKPIRAKIWEPGAPAATEMAVMLRLFNEFGKYEMISSVHKIAEPEI